LQDPKVVQNKATSLFIDSQSAIKLAKNLVFHSKKKHVDTKYHYLRTLVIKGIIKTTYCPTEDQTTDIFTKSLGIIKFTKFRNELGIISKDILDQREVC
jgi:hypothetical protein